MDSTSKIYDVVMAHLRSKAIPQKEVAQKTGVPHSTVAKIAQGSIKAPSVHHVQALYDFFCSKPEKREAA